MARSRMRGAGAFLALAVALGLAGATAPAAAAPMGDLPALKAASKLDPAVDKRGGEIYRGVCSACHDQGMNRAPQRYMLELMTPESIDLALTEGVMRAQAASLSPADRKAVAQYISGRPLGVSPRPTKMCPAGTSHFDVNEPPVFSGWGLSPGNSHAVPTRLAGLDRASAPRLKLKWALAFPNAIRARSQPALAAGAIFVGSHDGTVFALDRRTGCARWTFRAAAEVRTGIVVDPWRAGDVKARPRLYFGDLIGNDYALDARSGALVWKHKTDPHPNVTLTASPVLDNGVLYQAVSSLEEGRSVNPTYSCCTFRGSVIAYRAATGEVLWQTFMTEPPKPQGLTSKGVQRLGPAGVALWNSPSIDHKRGRLYIATGDSYSTPTAPLSDSILALDEKTGAVVWSWQALGDDSWNGACSNHERANCPPENGPDFDFGAATVLATDSGGRDYVLAGQKSGWVYAVDPDTGKPVWKTRVGRGGVIAGVSFGLAALGDTVYVPISDPPDGRTYDIPARPGVYALDLKTGAFRWQAPAKDLCGGLKFCHPGYAQAITATPQLVFAGANDGHLRILDAAHGTVLWDYDTLRDFTTVNGAVARGGAFGGGAAPIPYHGLLIASSGYGFAGAMAGNVLLVFEAK